MPFPPSPTAPPMAPARETTSRYPTGPAPRCPTKACPDPNLLSDFVDPSCPWIHSWTEPHVLLLYAFYAVVASSILSFVLHRRWYIASRSPSRAAACACTSTREVAAAAPLQGAGDLELATVELRTSKIGSEAYSADCSSRAEDGYEFGEALDALFYRDSAWGTVCVRLVTVCHEAQTGSHVRSD